MLQKDLAGTKDVKKVLINMTDEEYGKAGPMTKTWKGGCMIKPHTTIGIYCIDYWSYGNFFVTTPVVRTSPTKYQDQPKPVLLQRRNS